MKDFHQIFKTGIIPHSEDVFWETLPETVKTLTDKKVLIISADYAENSSEEQQLTKMMQACKLSNEDYNIIKLNDAQKISWHLLRERLSPKVVILLGIDPQALGIVARFRAYYANSFDDRIWIVSASLQELEHNQELKKSLWVDALKPVFVDQVKGDIS